MTGDANTPGNGAAQTGTIAYDATSGKTLWNTLYPGSDPDGDYGTAITSAGSDVFVTGSSYETLAMDAATGTLLWATSDAFGSSGEQIANSIASDGTEVVATGFSQGSTSGLDYGTVAFDP